MYMIPGFFLASFSSVLFSIWYSVWKLIPDKWLGLMDGYYYQSYIKNFTISPLIRDADFSKISIYPFYWFWIWGRIFSLSNIMPPTRYYWVTWLVAALLVVWVCYFLLKRFTKLTTSLGFASIYIAVIFYQNNIHIWEKPQELLAYPLSAALAVRLLASEKVDSRKNQIIQGILAGLLIGTYYPAAIIILLPSLAIIAIEYKKLFISSFKYFLLALLITAFPELYCLASIFIKFHNFGGYPAFQNSEYFFTAWISLPILMTWIAVNLFLSTNCSLVIKRLRILIALLLSWYVLQTFFYQYGFTLPRSDLILQCCLALILLQLLLAMEKYVDASPFNLLIILLACSLFLTSYAGLNTNSDVTSSIELSIGRSHNDELIRAAKLYEKYDCGKTIVANGEFQFISTQTNCNTPMYLPFNEGYVTENVPYVKRIDFIANLNALSRQSIRTEFSKTNVGFVALYKNVGTKISTFQFLTYHPGIQGDSPTSPYNINWESFKSVLLNIGWRMLYEDDQVLLISR